MSEQDATHTSGTVGTYAAEVPKQAIQPWELKQDILERFDALAQCEDNWDGYDSKKTDCINHSSRQRTLWQNF